MVVIPAGIITDLSPVAHGVGATLDDIARVAGIPKAGLVDHFRTKDADAVQETGGWLMAELSGDGLPDEVSAFVVSAADGATASLMWGSRLDEPRHRLLERRLVDLTRHPNWWVSLPWNGDDA